MPTSQRHLRTLVSTLCLACTLSLYANTTAAAPTVTANNMGDTTTEATDATNPETDSEIQEDTQADPQVAPMPASPFRTEPNPDALANPNSLASGMQPSDSDLSAANQELLGRNAQLQRDVNDLETRVNVLINERSGQLFMYGVVTVIIALLIGFMLGWYVFDRRKRW